MTEMIFIIALLCGLSVLIVSLLSKKIKDDECMKCNGHMHNECIHCNHWSYNRNIFKDFAIVCKHCFQTLHK